MKRAMPSFPWAALAALAFVAAAHAAGASRANPPPGVAASSWVPITHDFGAVVERRMPDAYATGQPLASALGYFVVRRAGHWLRLDSLLLQSRALRSPPAASQRIVIDGNLRFVVERQMPGQPMRAQPAMPSALGYFMVKHRDQWLRLVPDPQGALYRGPLRPPSTSDWVPIGKTLRFVIEQQTPERDAGPAQLPSVLGYFVGKHGGRWLRLGSIA
ncbi:MAG TPA: hypothetical protein VHE11_14180 [Steroidobacteraceae bacterium]|nr:hypothetical protein [Steroidobacteraceae bacterium]